MFEVGLWLSEVPVPMAVPPELWLYQVRVPELHEAVSETELPEQIVILSTLTLVGLLGWVVTVTCEVATRLLSQELFLQLA